jgi:RNA polymerase sigma-70 factor (ECF subfamily)
MGDDEVRRDAASEYEDFYQGCATRLAGQLYLLLGDRDEARDCVQDALVQAWLRWDRVRTLQDPQGWVRTVARRRAISRWRRSRNAVTAWTRKGNHPARAETSDADRRMDLVSALRQLPEPQRTVLVLHHLCDLEVAAIAAELSVPVSTVTSRLARGRAALSELLGRDDLDDLDHDDHDDHVAPTTEEGALR